MQVLTKVIERSRSRAPDPKLVALAMATLT